MIRKLFHFSWKILFETAMVLLVIILLSVGGLLWRLSQGSIQLGEMFRSRLVKSLELEDIGLNASLPALELAWDGPKSPVALRARDVTLYNMGSSESVNDDSQNPDLLKIEKIDLTLSLRGLLGGKARPVFLGLDGVTLKLQRLENGQVVFGQPRPPRSSPSAMSYGLLQDILASSLPRRHFLTDLSTVRLTRGSAHITDANPVRNWSFPTLNLELQRNGEGWSGSGDASLMIEAKSTRKISDLDLTFTYLKATGRTSLAFGFNGLNPQNLLAFDSVMAAKIAATASLDVPLDGFVTLSLNRDFQPMGVDADIHQRAAGTITLPSLWPSPRPLERFSMKSSINLTDKTGTLNHFTARLDGVTIGATGQLNPVATGHEIAAIVTFDKMPTERLADFWPEKAAPNARAWVKDNIRNGGAEKATLSLSLLQTPEKTSLSNLKGSFLFKGLDIHYFGELDSAKNISGRCDFDRNAMRFNVEGGSVNAVGIGKGSVIIDGFENARENITLDLPLNGRIADILTVIDRKPLRYASFIGVKPENVQGNFIGNFGLSLPLRKDVRWDEATLNATGNLDGVVIPALLGLLDVQNGKARLKVSQSRLEMQGIATTSDVVTEFSWVENFYREKSPFATRLTFAGNANDALRDHFVPAASAWIDGITPISGSFTIDSKGVSRLGGTLDAAAATVSVPPLGYQKPADTSASLSATLRFDGKNLAAIETFNLDAPKLAAKGTVNWQNGRFQSLELQNIRWLDSTLSLLKLASSNKGWDITAKGTQLYIYPFLEWQSTQPRTERKIPDFSVNLELSTLKITRDGILSAVNGHVSWQKNQLADADIQLMADNSPASLNIAVTGEGNRNFALKADNAGALLRALAVTKSVRGGKVSIVTSAAANNPQKYDGLMEMENFRLVDAPLLAELLNGMSAMGVVNLLRNEGLQFEILQSRIGWEKSRLLLNRGRTFGSALGLSFSGNINIAAQTLDIEGAVTPIRFLNQGVLGRIPLLGKLLTGKDSEGLLAWRYKLRGKLANPEVSVNPLSTLTPGFIRDIFFLDEEKK